MDKLTLSWGYVHENRIGWTVPEVDQTVPTLQIEYYPRLPKRPFGFHRMPARCFTSVRHGTHDHLFYGKTTANKLLEAFTGGTDDGATFSGVIETRWFEWGLPLNTKYLRRARIIGRGRFFVSFFRNFGTGVLSTRTIDLTGDEILWDEAGDLWDDENWGPGAILKEIEIHPDVYGRYISFRIHDTETVERSRTVDVADVDVSIPAGEWALYGLTAHAVVMGEGL